MNVALRAVEPLSRIGRYPVEEEIDRNGSGVVYRGIHPGLRLPVAIKLFAGSLSRDPAFAARFKRETAAIAALGHPSIVRVFDVDLHGGALFVVTEFVPGSSLRARLLNDRRLEAALAVDLVRQVLSAVGGVHSLGITHGHLKPENVFVTKDGQVRIGDFGVSQLLSDSAYAAGAARLIHTGAYLAPEQVMGEQPTPASDIYSIGAMLFELLEGQPPFSGPVPTVLHAHLYQQPRSLGHLPRELEGVVVKALAKDPAARFASCAEFAAALVTPVSPKPSDTRRFRLPIFGT